MDNNQAKRTIKLKPLTKKSPSPEPGAPGVGDNKIPLVPPAPQAVVAAPPLMVNPSSPTIEAKAPVMDENGNIPEESVEETVSMPPDEISKTLEDQTQKVVRSPTPMGLAQSPRQTIKLRPATMAGPVVGAPPSAPAMTPPPIPGGPTLGPIKLKPVSTPTIPQPMSPSAAPEAKTVVLSPMTPAPVPEGDENAPAQTATEKGMNTGVDEEKTVAIPRKPPKTPPPAQDQADDTSTADMGAVKHSTPTMKLGPPPTATAVPGAGKTIKLKPVTPTKPSTPTIKTDGQAVATTPSVPKPSSPTIKLSASGATQALPAPELPPEEGAAKSRLSIRKGEDTGASSISDIKEGQLGPSGAMETSEVAEEGPSMVQTAASALALVALLVGTLILAAQFANLWLGQNIQLPVLSQLVK